MKPKGTQLSYYHGTASGIKGDVKPSSPEAYRGVDPSMVQDKSFLEARAYATRSEEDAGNWAKNKAKGQGRLFGSVYEVEPHTVIGTDGDTKYGPPSPMGSPGHIADPEGLKNLGHRGFVDYKGDKL